MPQQLIYTSAPRGIVAGRSGHCTVARSASMREALTLQLEKLSYYQHLSLSGGRERPIFACRIVDIRGTRFHVLSQIQDAGLDFTGRTNFIAHHLVFTPEEIRQFPTPPAILRNWPGWLRSWTKEPQLLEKENWDDLNALAGKSSGPAQTWQRVSGDAVNGYGLLEAQTGASFRVDDQTEETILELFAESLELLYVRGPRREFRTAAWNYTFTTSMQEQDNPADFRWRCIHSDNPAADRFATTDCRTLSAIRATKWTDEEITFSRTGRQAPRFVAEPQNIRITEGGAARFTARAEGVPSPTYQWFSVDRSNSAQVLPNETNPELVVSNPGLGVLRYVVSADNSAGSARSNVATLSVEAKLKVPQLGVDTDSSGPAKTIVRITKSGENVDSQRKRLAPEKAEGIFDRSQRRTKVVAMVLTIVLAAGASIYLAAASNSVVAASNLVVAASNSVVAAAKSAAAATDSVVAAAKSAAAATNSAAAAANSAAAAANSAADAAKLVATASKLVVTASNLVVTATNSAADAANSAADAANSAADAAKSAAAATKSAAAASNLVVTARNSAAAASKLVVTPSKLVVTASNLVVTASNLVVTTSKLFVTARNSAAAASELVLTQSELVVTASNLLDTASKLVDTAAKSDVAVSKLVFNAKKLVVDASKLPQTVRISSQPVAREVNVNSTATFTVVATGTARLAYQWRKDGVTLEAMTNATLSLTNVQNNQAGAYTVVVRNTAGSVTSSAATLTVGEATSFL